MAGENLPAYRELTEQYIKDMEAAQDAYTAKRDELMQGVSEEVKALNQEYMQQAMDLSKTYLEDLRELSEGEQPEENG